MNPPTWLDERGQRRHAGCAYWVSPETRFGWQLSRHRRSGPAQERKNEQGLRQGQLPLLPLTTGGGHDIGGGPDRVPDPRRHWRRRHRQCGPNCCPSSSRSSWSFRPLPSSIISVLYSKLADTNDVATFVPPPGDRLQRADGL
jgi:hypothetical protein